MNMKGNTSENFFKVTLVVTLMVVTFFLGILVVSEPVDDEDNLVPFSESKLGQELKAKGAVPPSAFDCSQLAKEVAASGEPLPSAFTNEEIIKGRCVRIR